jgi:hypothetical protein
MLTGSRYVSANSANDYEVSLEDAEFAAKYYVDVFGDQFDGWEGADVEEPILYYGVHDEVSAYEFNITNNRKNVGYMIISASEEYGPIRECGSGEPPSSSITIAYERAVEKGFIDKEQAMEPKFLYWSGLSSSVQFGKSMENDGIAINLSYGTVGNVPEEVVLQVDKDKAKERWQNVIAIKQGQVPDEKYTTDKESSNKIASLSKFIQMSLDTMLRNDRINGGQYWQASMVILEKQLEIEEPCRDTDVVDDEVPDYWQKTSPLHGDDGNDGSASWPTCAGPGNDPWAPWDGCGPIAASNVLGYWRDHDDAYSDVPEDYDELIDDLHHFMQTSDGGATSTSLIDNGIELAFDEYGYDFDASNDGSVSWNDIKYQVSLNQPAVLSVFNGVMYTNHGVTAFGYWEFEENLVIHRKGSSSGLHFLEYGDWTSAVLTRVEEN